MKKKLVSLLLGAVMCTSTVAGLAACGGGRGGNEKYDYEIKVWVGEKTDTLTRQMIDEFNKTNTLKDGQPVKFKATVQVVSESSAAGDILAKKEDAPDVYSFAQDQLARLVSGGMISQLSQKFGDAVLADNDEGSAKAAKVGNAVYAFPMTSDNTYFMYYNKNVVKAEHIGDLASIVADCEAAQNYFAMSLSESGAWYAASFFFGAGCVSEWPTSEDGIFTAGYEDTFNSDAGVIALKGMQILLDSDWHLDEEAVAVSAFAAGTPAAVVISGTWDYEAALEAASNPANNLDLGIAPLPKFSVDGVPYQLKPFAGYKMMGVKPQSDGYKQYYLQQLALYLTNEENQLKRFDAVSWGPSNKNAQQSEAVQANEALKAVAAQAEFSVVQGQYPTNWWSDVASLCGNAKGASESSLRGSLATYASNFSGYVGSGGNE